MQPFERLGDKAPSIEHIWLGATDFGTYDFGAITDALHEGKCFSAPFPQPSMVQLIPFGKPLQEDSVKFQSIYVDLGSGMYNPVQPTKRLGVKGFVELLNKVAKYKLDRSDYTPMGRRVVERTMMLEIGTMIDDRECNLFNAKTVYTILSELNDYLNVHSSGVNSIIGFDKTDEPHTDEQLARRNGIFCVYHYVNN